MTLMKFPSFQNILSFSKKLINKKIIIGLIVLLLVWNVGSRNAQDTSQIKTYKVSQKTIKSTVISSGKIQADQSTDLHFQTSGQLAWINAKQGDHVNKGQTIASLDTQVLQKQLKEDLNTYFKTRLTFEDTKDSQQNQVITDTLKRIAQRSQADLENSVTDVEIKDLAVRFSTVASPIDGYIISDPIVYPGSNVFVTDTIVTVANTKSLQFLAEVDETDIGKITTGQKTAITLDAYPNDKFDSEVSLISPKAVTTSTGATAFNTTFNMDTQKQLLIGMNGSAEITTATKENVLTVPVDALVYDTFVWTKDGNKYTKKEISKDLESENDVEITSGLTEGETIVTSGFDQLQKASLFQKLTRLVVK
jgi:HlyD family secretion protein